ncbi:hypothetical protein Hanom_Chr16g01476691 [Helianthus anomalus]
MLDFHYFMPYLVLAYFYTYSVFVVELGVSLEATTLSLGIEVRFNYISLTSDPTNNIAIGEIYWVQFVVVL